MFKYRDTKKQYHGSALSFGAGVQSTAILLLLLHKPEKVLEAVGHLPNHIIFADTKAESDKALKNMEYCKSISPVPFHVVTNEKRNALSHPLDLPLFVTSTASKRGQMRRQCTAAWKIRPIKRCLRTLFPLASKKRQLSLWLGISTDEITRMKLSNVKYIEHVYPLIEMNLDRAACIDIVKQYKLTPVKSACYMCPYQGKRWKTNPQIDEAVAYEERLQANSHLKGTPYLHSSLKPLKQVYQQMQDQYELFTFDEECDGYCGL